MEPLTIFVAAAVAMPGLRPALGPCLTYEAPVSLEGTLSPRLSRAAAGREAVQIWVLRLVRSVCVAGAPPLREVELVLDAGTRAAFADAADRAPERLPGLRLRLEGRLRPARGAGRQAPVLLAVETPAGG